MTCPKCQAKFVTTNENPHAELCLAALESREAVHAKAREYKIGRREVARILCNETPIMKFAAEHRTDVNDWAIATVQ